jgi:hypothetical protein
VLYRIDNGTWRKVLNPETEAMRSGEAFWIYCKGSSDYQGPLRVETLSPGGLMLRGNGDEIVLRNESGYPLLPEIRHVVSGGNGISLSVGANVIDDEAGGIKSFKILMEDDDWSAHLAPLEAGAAARIPFALQSEKMSVAEAQTLICIKTDVGTETWLPVQGLREDLK